MNKYAYKGQVITASSKENAIKKIIAKSDENILFKKVLDACKRPDEKVVITNKNDKYSSCYTLIRKGNIVNIDNTIGDLDWAGIRKSVTEAKKLFNQWKQLAQKECDGKIKFKNLVTEVIKEKSVYKD